jgi:uncharacterized protein
MLDGFAIPRRLDQVKEIFPEFEVADVTQAVLQFAQLGLLRPAGEVETACSASPDTIIAWLHVTNRCNLHCSYCYVHQSDAMMNERTARAAVQAVFRSAVRHNFRAVKLKYAGGEPTLNFPLLRLLHRCARALADRHGLELKEVILSNGVALTDEMLIALRDMGMRLAVSLDGVGAVHDAQRGRGTFAKVAGSIDRAIGLDLRPHVSVTVTSQNIDSLPDVVSYILERDLLFNLNFYRAHDCPVDRDGLKVDSQRLIEGVRASLVVVEERLPRQSLVGGLLDRVYLGYPHTLPCGAGKSYVVVGCEGRISMCQMEMDRGVGSIWEGDPLLAVRTSEGRFVNLEVDTKSECGSCPWRYWCAGGCPLLTYRLTGRNDARSPYCEVYQALLPELLRLEGLRLLRSPPAA